MRKWFKYALAFLAVCLVFAFFNRERMTTASASEPPAKPERLLVPYGNVLYTEGGDDEGVQKSESNLTSSFPIDRE